MAGARRPPARVWAGVALLALFLGLLQTALVAERSDGSAGAPSSSRGVAQVQVDARAYEGPRGTILASLRGRCAPGFEVVELALDFAQGELTTPTLLGRPFPCDGRWHRQRVTSLEAFQPGPATLTARLTVVRRSTGEPVPPVVDHQRIHVRPAAAVVLPSSSRLRPDGAITMVVRARCDAPWVVQDFRVAATQGEVPNVASGGALLGLTCDGTMRRVAVRIEPDGAPFRRGDLLVDAEITLLDPEFFDPVTQARATRTVRVR